VVLCAIGPLYHSTQPPGNSALPTRVAAHGKQVLLLQRSHRAVPQSCKKETIEKHNNTRVLPCKRKGEIIHHKKKGASLQQE